MRAKPEVPWSEIDTVLVDMDGTLLDLAFDNYFWLELVPSRYARLNRISEQQARDDLKQRYDSIAGSLSWYCIDHWTSELGLDICALKLQHKHLIRYLPMVPEFLLSVRRRGKRLILVTNAHRVTLSLKTAQTGLDEYVDALISSHDLNAAKESQSFWRALTQREPFDPQRSLLIEDSVPVLTAAREFGLRHVIAVRCPDSSQQARRVDGFETINGVAELI